MNTLTEVVKLVRERIAEYDQIIKDDKSDIRAFDRLFSSDNKKWKYLSWISRSRKNMNNIIKRRNTLIKFMGLVNPRWRSQCKDYGSQVLNIYELEKELNKFIPNYKFFMLIDHENNTSDFITISSPQNKDIKLSTAVLDRS